MKQSGDARAGRSDRRNVRKLLFLALPALTLFFPAGASALTLFGLVDTGELYASADHGVTWLVRAALPVHDAVALAAGSSASELYLASRSGLVYRSANAGVDWNAVGAVSASDVVDLAILPDLSIVVLTATGSVYRSTDHGTSFSAMGGLTGSDFVSSDFIPGAPLRLYALGRSGGVHESTDGGANWTAAGAITVPDAVELRSIGAQLCVLTSTGDLYSSTNGGASWIAVGTLSQSGTTSLTRDGSTLVAATGAGEVATSADGVTWTWRGAINQLTVTALANDVPAVTGVPEPGGRDRFRLSGPWPNPAHAGRAVAFHFDLPQDETVGWEIIDVTGRLILTRPAEPLAAGGRDVSLTMPESAPGVLFIRVLTCGAGSQARRVVIVP